MCESFFRLRALVVETLYCNTHSSSSPLLSRRGSQGSCFAPQIRATGSSGHNSGPTSNGQSRPCILFPLRTTTCFFLVSTERSTRCQPALKLVYQNLSTPCVSTPLGIAFVFRHRRSIDLSASSPVRYLRPLLESSFSCGRLFLKSPFYCFLTISNSASLFLSAVVVLLLAIFLLVIPPLLVNLLLPASMRITIRSIQTPHNRSIIILPPPISMHPLHDRN